MATSKPFHTSDTPLATYLTIHDIELARLDTTSKPAVFTFTPDAEGRINDLIMAWDMEDAQGNCHAFFIAYRRYVRKIKDAQIPNNR